MTRQEQIQAYVNEVGYSAEQIPLIVDAIVWADENNQNGYMVELTEKCEELDDMEAKLQIAVEALEKWPHTFIQDCKCVACEALAKISAIGTTEGKK